MQFKIVSMLAIVTVIAIQFAICRLPPGRASATVATTVFLAIMCYGIATLIYSSDLTVRGFSIGLLLPAVVFLFGNTTIVTEVMPARIRVDEDPFGDPMKYELPNIYAFLSIVGMFCGVLINIFGALLCRNAITKQLTQK